MYTHIHTLHVHILGSKRCKRQTISKAIRVKKLGCPYQRDFMRNKGRVAFPPFPDWFSSTSPRSHQEKGCHLCSEVVQGPPAKPVLSLFISPVAMFFRVRRRRGRGKSSCHRHSLSSKSRRQRVSPWAGPLAPSPTLLLMLPESLKTRGS